MTTPPRKPRKPQVRNPEWSDTREQKAARQRKRYAKMKAFAVERGYKSWSVLVTAILNGDVEIIIKNKM